MEITIPGDPTPQKRPRLSKHAVYDPSSKDKEAVEWLLKVAANEQQWIPKMHPYTVEMVFFCPYPKNSPKHLVPRGDLDNLAKLILDAGNGVLWPDDRYIVALHLAKKYSAEPKTTIKVIV